MTALITAEEARKLSPESEVESWLAYLSNRIKDAATAGKTSIRFPYELTEIRVEESVYPRQGTGKIVAQRLVDAGFTLKDHWECLQFVDAYLTVEW